MSAANSMDVSQSLYSRDVLRLATSLPHGDRLDHADGSASRHSAVCGSEMLTEVAMENGRILQIAFRPRACALGQASAALLRSIAIGRREAEIAALRGGVAAALGGDGAMPDDFTALSYARDYPARHSAILLPFDALLAAIDQVGRS
jgi:NifU-like protein involved in Fe-S cluster formation